MLIPGPTHEEMWRGVVKRNVDLLWRTAQEFFRPGELLAVEIDPSGLDAKVWVASPRSEELLREINKRTFRSFAFLGIHAQNVWYWTHFQAM
jgi:hypothetical protein